MGTQPHINITRTMMEALWRVHKRGPESWDAGRGRAGGAVSRMFDRMVAAGLVSKPPYIPTPRGLQALDEWESQYGNPEAHR